jgi:hypothetical protein
MPRSGSALESGDDAMTQHAGYANGAEAEQIGGRLVLDELFETPARALRRAPAPPVVEKAVARQMARAQGFSRAVRGLRSHLRQGPGGPRLAISHDAIPRVARQLGIQPRGVEILVRSAARGRAAQAREFDDEAFEVVFEFDFETGTECQGVTRYSLEWWGHRLALSSCATDNLLDVAEAGAAAATVCAAIPALKNQVVCGVAAGALTLGRLVIRRIHERGGRRGIVIRQPHLGPPVIWHQ